MGLLDGRNKVRLSQNTVGLGRVIFEEKIGHMSCFAKLF